MYRNWQPHKEATKSLQAVLAAYRSGSPIVEAGKVTVVRRGSELGLLSEKEVHSELFDEKPPVCKDEHGPGCIWVENVCSLRCHSLKAREANFI